jgi:hypothetical protein
MELEIYCVYCEVGTEAIYNAVELHASKVSDINPHPANVENMVSS